jgi:hypothetical protein
MVRYEFGPSSCNRLAHWLGEALCRGPSSDGLWVARTGRGGLSTRWMACTFYAAANVPSGDCKRKAAWTCWTKPATRLGSKS